MKHLQSDVHRLKQELQFQREEFKTNLAMKDLET